MIHIVTSTIMCTEITDTQYNIITGNKEGPDVLTIEQQVLDTSSSFQVLVTFKFQELPRGLTSGKGLIRDGLCLASGS